MRGKFIQVLFILSFLMALPLSAGLARQGNDTPAAPSAPAPATFALHPVQPELTLEDPWNTAAELADLDGDGDLDAVIAGSGTSGVFRNDGSGVFSLVSSFYSGTSNDVALGDIDGDGDIDAVFASDFNQAEQVWKNDGDANFTLFGSFGADQSNAIALGDIDGDNDLDAIVANSSNQAETVWVNDGSGNFSAHPTTPSLAGAGFASYDIALGDVDADGDLDAVVAEFSGAQVETVWKNNGSGSFSAAGSFGGDGGFAMAMADIDGDSDLDVVTAGWDGDPEYAFKNDGTGVFTLADTLAGDTSTQGVVLADLDNDGDVDLLAANSNSEAEEVWLNNGSGDFSLHSHFGAGDSKGAAVGDVDGDGDLDALIANLYSDNLIYLNTGFMLISATTPNANQLDVSRLAAPNAVLTQALNQPSVQAPGSVVLYSMERGGLSFAPVTFPLPNSFTLSPNQPFLAGETVYVSAAGSIVSASGEPLAPKVWQFTTATAETEGLFHAHPTTPEVGSGDSRAAALGDLDRDGDLDAIVVGNDHPATIYRNDGHGVLTLWSTFGTTGGSDIALGDYNGDNYLDAIVANPSDNTTCWVNNGSGGMLADPVDPNCGQGSSGRVAIADFNADGRLDAFITYPSGNFAVMYINNNSGEFIPEGSYNGLTDIGEIAVGDLDNDGDLDVVAAVSDGGVNNILVNSGAGGLVMSHSLGAAFTGVRLGDLDGDGDLDVFTTDNGGTSERVYRNEGGLVFSVHATFGGNETSTAALGDVDGDGDLDALLANTSGAAEEVYLNDGTGSFNWLPFAEEFGAQDSLDIQLGDLNNDGDLDAFVTNTNGQPETVWMNDDGFPVYGLETFDGDPFGAWSNPITSTAPCGENFLGEFNNESVFMGFEGLPPHDLVKVSFDLYLLRSWDGNQPTWPEKLMDLFTAGMRPYAPNAPVGPDRWSLSYFKDQARGLDLPPGTLLDTTFSNWDLLEFSQAYPGVYAESDFPSRTGAQQANSLCYSFNGNPMDAVYSLSFTFPHDSGYLEFDFNATGLQDITDESWGLDNVLVQVYQAVNQVYLPVLGK